MLTFGADSGSGDTIIILEPCTYVCKFSCLTSSVQELPTIKWLVFLTTHISLPVSGSEFCQRVILSAKLRIIVYFLITNLIISSIFGLQFSKLCNRKYDF